jgi:hypothetical protein
MQRITFEEFKTVENREPIRNYGPECKNAKLYQIDNDYIISHYAEFSRKQTCIKIHNVSTDEIIKYTTRCFNFDKLTQFSYLLISESSKVLQTIPINPSNLRFYKPPITCNLLSVAMILLPKYQNDDTTSYALSQILYNACVH